MNARLTRSEQLILVLGGLACLYFHLFSLSGLPGFHYDEAWAMNYSWRIAFEKGFWPWQAMSPYTAPWAHYWAALWFRVFGASLVVFRGSQIALSLAAVFLFSRVLWRLGYGRAAAFFPGLVALFPALVLNHRFAIELNGLHPFIFVLLCAAIAKGKPGWAATFWVIGTTAHILFYGVGLGLVAACVWEKRGFSVRERKALGFGALALALFFCRVLVEVPEKGKAGALLLSSLGLVVISAWPGLLALLDKFPRWKYLPPVFGAAFYFNLLFFADGAWTLGIYTGVFFEYFGLVLLSIAFFLLFAVYSWLELRHWPAILRQWFWFGLFLLGIMMLKPAPRYFEIPLFALAAIMAFAFSRESARKLSFSLLAFGIHSYCYYIQILPIVPFEREQHLLFFKDSSRDFLSKQKLAQFLGGAGCGISDIKSVDSRVREALQALSYGDWPVVGNCSVKDLRITRSTESPLKTKTIADFVLEGSEADGAKK